MPAGPCHSQTLEGLRHQHSPGPSSAMIVQSPEVCASVLSNISLQMVCINFCGGQSRSLHLRAVEPTRIPGELQSQP